MILDALGRITIAFSRADFSTRFSSLCHEKCPLLFQVFNPVFTHYVLQYYNHFSTKLFAV